MDQSQEDNLPWDDNLLKFACAYPLLSTDDKNRIVVYCNLLKEAQYIEEHYSVKFDSDELDSEELDTDQLDSAELDSDQPDSPSSEIKFDSTKLDTDQLNPVELGLVQPDSPTLSETDSKLDSDELDLDQSDSSELDTDQHDPTELDSVQPDSPTASETEFDFAKLNHDQLDTDQLDSNQLDFDQSDSTELDTNQLDSVQPDSPPPETEFDFAELNHDQLDTDQLDTDQLDTDQLDTDQLDSNQLDLDQSDSTELDTNQLDSVQSDSPPPETKLNRDLLDPVELGSDQPDSPLPEAELDSAELNRDLLDPVKFGSDQSDSPPPETDFDPTQPNDTATQALPICSLSDDYNNLECQQANEAIDHFDDFHLAQFVEVKTNNSSNKPDSVLEQSDLVDAPGAQLVNAPDLESPEQSIEIEPESEQPGTSTFLQPEYAPTCEHDYASKVPNPTTPINHIAASSAPISPATTTLTSALDDDELPSLEIDWIDSVEPETSVEPIAVVAPIDLEALPLAPTKSSSSSSVTSIDAETQTEFNQRSTSAQTEPNKPENSLPEPDSSLENGQHLAPTIIHSNDAPFVAVPEELEATNSVDACETISSTQKVLSDFGEREESPKVGSSANDADADVDDSGSYPAENEDSNSNGLIIDDDDINGNSLDYSMVNYLPGLPRNDESNLELENAAPESNRFPEFASTTRNTAVSTQPTASSSSSLPASSPEILTTTICLSNQTEQQSNAFKVPSIGSSNLDLSAFWKPSTSTSSAPDELCPSTLSGLPQPVHGKKRPHSEIPKRPKRPKSPKRPKRSKSPKRSKRPKHPNAAPSSAPAPEGIDINSDPEPTSSSVTLPITCLSCRMEFVTSCSFNRHQIAVHQGGSLHLCPFCKREFAVRDERHERRCEEELRLLQIPEKASTRTVPPANSTHSTQSTQNQHNSLPCRECSTKCSDLLALKEHLLDYHQGRGLHTCPFCDKKTLGRDVEHEMSCAEERSRQRKEPGVGQTLADLCRGSSGHRGQTGRPGIDQISQPQSVQSNIQQPQPFTAYLSQPRASSALPTAPQIASTSSYQSPPNQPPLDRPRPASTSNLPNQPTPNSTHPSQPLPPNPHLSMSQKNPLLYELIRSPPVATSSSSPFTSSFTNFRVPNSAVQPNQRNQLNQQNQSMPQLNQYPPSSTNQHTHQFLHPRQLALNMQAFQRPPPLNQQRNSLPPFMHQNSLRHQVQFNYQATRIATPHSQVIHHQVSMIHQQSFRTQTPVSNQHPGSAAFYQPTNPFQRFPHNHQNPPQHFFPNPNQRPSQHFPQQNPLNPHLGFRIPNNYPGNAFHPTMNPPQRPSQYPPQHTSHNPFQNPPSSTTPHPRRPPPLHTTTQIPTQPVPRIPHDQPLTSLSFAAIAIQMEAERNKLHNQHLQRMAQSIQPISSPAQSTHSQAQNARPNSMHQSGPSGSPF